MKPGVTCRWCGRVPPGIAGVRAVAAALEVDDVDAALQRDLMTLDCNDCLSAAGATVADIHLIDTAIARLHTAWAARERHRVRNARLQVRAAKQRAPRAPASADSPMKTMAAADATSAPASQLPAAAASALERALARVSKR